MRFSTPRPLALMLPLVVLTTGCAVGPQPFTVDELHSQAQDVAARVVADQEPVQRSIDLYEAMARALKYNRDHRVEVYEQALKATELRVAHAGMLPTLVASSGYAARDNDLASSSFNLLTQAPNFGFSTSQERRNQVGDLTFSWHVLDFGLSYVRAQQAADKVLLAGENRRRVLHRLLEEVRTAYWKAVSAERLDTRLRGLEGRVKRALSGSRALVNSGETTPITQITYRRELLEVLRTVQELRRELSLAKYQLAALMNLKPGTRFQLHAAQHDSAAPDMKLSADGMISVALTERPELRDVAYRRRINTREAKAMLLELLPGLQLYAGVNADHNMFLLNQDWLSWGAKASWNVMKLFTHRDREAVVAAQDGLLDQRALALTMAVMTQVHVSRARYQHFAYEQKTARDYLATQRDLLWHLNAEHRADRVSEQTLLREEMNGLVAEVRADVMQSNLQSAKAAILTAMGLDLVPEHDAASASVKDVAGALRRTWITRGTETSWSVEHAGRTIAAVAK